MILLLGLIVAMEMEGWTHCIMGYITLVCSGCILHILANLEGLLGVVCNQKFGIFYTASLRHTVEIVAWYDILNDCWVSESSECGFEDQTSLKWVMIISFSCNGKDSTCHQSDCLLYLWHTFLKDFKSKWTPQTQVQSPFMLILISF